MKLKKLLALILALVMVFSLAACAAKDKDDEKEGEKTEQTDKKDDAEEDKDDEKEDEKTEQTDKKDDAEEDKDDKEPAPAAKDYTALVDCFKSFAANPSMKGFAELAGGDLAGDAMYEFLQAYMALVGMSEDDFVDMAAADYENVSVTDSSAEPLTEDELAEYQAEADEVAAGFRSMIEDVTGTTDEEWEEIASQFGMSADEAKALGEDIVSALQKLVDLTENLKIDEGQRVTIVTDQGEEEFCFFLSGGKWFSDGLMEMQF